MYRTVLYCTVLYCTVLYCTVLYCTVLYCTVLYCTVPMALWIAEPKRLFSSCVVSTSSAHTSGQGPGFNTPQWEVTSPVRHVRNKGSRIRFLRSHDLDQRTLHSYTGSGQVFLLMFELSNSLQRSSNFGKAHCTANLHYGTVILSIEKKIEVHVYKV